MVVLVALCGMGALPWLDAAGVDLDSLPDIDDDQFWSTYKASIPYQDYVRLGQDAADHVDRYGPRQMPGENDTLFRFRRFLRIQKELDKRLLLYYEMNSREQERERDYEENRKLQKLSHNLHANPPVAQQQQQHRQHRFGQYQLPYPNQQMLDDVRPYPHEDTLHNNDFSFDHDDPQHMSTYDHQRHHDVANANDPLWGFDAATGEASGGGAKGLGGVEDVWEEKERGQEEFAIAPPDPRFYDRKQQQKDFHQYDTPTTPPQPPRPRPDTFPLVPPRHIDVSSRDGSSEEPARVGEAMKLTQQKDGEGDAGTDDGVTTPLLMVQPRNSLNGGAGGGPKSEPKEAGGSGGGFRFNMVGKWPALGTGIGEKHLVIGNPSGEFPDTDTLQVQPVQHLHRFGAGESAGVYIIAIVAGISAAATVGLIAFGIGWYNLQKHVKSTSDVEYPAYGVTGPNKELSPSGDRRLAQSAQMYHYQHQKQQIIAMESRAAAGERHGSISQADSDEENEEGDYTVYECPGLAPTGEMEVKNPMFNDEPTPAQTPQVKADQPQN